MSHQADWRECHLILLLATSFLAAAALLAEEPTEIPAYRRVFVPAEDLASQAKGMIPVKRDEFERRIKPLAGRLAKPSAAPVRVERAVYCARLEGSQWVDGRAELDLISSAGEVAVFSWDPCNLAIGKAMWDETPPRTARLGTTPSGAASLIVEKSGRLLVPWSLRGRMRNSQESEYDIQLPSGTMHRLVLQLPSTLILKAEPGIASRLGQEAAENNLFRGVSKPGTVNWLVELGGQAHTRLHVSSASDQVQRDALTLVREAATHLLSPVDVSTEFALQLDVHQAGLETLKLVVDSRVRITGVRMAAQSLSWRADLAADPEETRLQVDLPEPMSGVGHLLTVSFVSPLLLDRPFRLPRMSLLGGTWQEGTATVVTPASLRLQRIELQEARQASVSQASPTQPEEKLQFQYHSVKGKIEINAGREQKRLRILEGLVVRHEVTQLSAVWQADLSVDAGERFELEGVTGEDWVIDSVDTSPSDLLEERHYVPVEGRKYALRLRFARPLTPKAKTRVVVRAHRPLPAEGEQLGIQVFRLVEFHDASDEQLVVALRAVDTSREFQLSGELDLLRIDPESAAPDELNLLESSPAGLLFRLNRQVEAAKVALVPSDPRYSVSIECLASVQRGIVEHRTLARVTPFASSVARLLVRSSGATPAALRWKLADGSNLSIATQTLLPAHTPPLADDGGKESVWELVLNRATTQPFSLEAAWEAPFVPGDGLPLFSFPEATAQDGLLRVEAGQGLPLRLETEGTKQVPAPLAAAGEYSSIRGQFRYEPGRRTSVILRTQPKEEVLPAAWVNSCSMLSRYVADGSGVHEITWQLENNGLDRFPFSLPDGASLVQASITGEEAPIAATDAVGGQQVVPLPGFRRYPVVTLVVATRPSPTGAILAHRWSAPIVTTSLPVLDRTWRVELPPGFKLIDDSQAASTTWYSLWKNRLWGIFQGTEPAGPLPDSEDDPSFRPWSETEPLSVWVYSPKLLQTWGIALAIAVASLIFWNAPGRSVLVVAMATLFACAALLSPAAYAPLAAGLFWGASLGGLLVLVRQRRPSQRLAGQASPPSTQMMRDALAGALLLVVVAWIGTSAAAPAADAAKLEPSKTYKVVIPVDADRQPTGDYVYVPLDFYSLLHRAPERPDLPASLLRSVAYEIETPPEKTAASIITMRAEIETLAEKAKIALPLRRGEVHLLEGRTTLDGQPMTLDWDEAGSSLRVEIERPGLYQLTLVFSTAPKLENDTSTWKFAVPRCPRAALRISSLEQPGEWSSPGSLGASAMSPEDGDVLVDLGSTGTLAISRSEAQKEHAAGGVGEGEQLVWWKIRPGSVSAEALFRVRPLRGKLSEIKLLADPRLRLLPLENEPRVVRTWAEEGETNIYHLLLVESTAEQIELRARFLLLEASGVGKFVPPQVEILTPLKLKHWQAITIGKETEITPSPDIAFTPHTPTEFIESWGAASKPPNIAFEFTGPAPAFLLRPQEVDVHGSEMIDVSLGRHDAEVRYRVDLKGVPTDRFQETADIPPGFQVRSVSLQEQESAVPIRWQFEPGVLIMHRGQPPAGAQRILVEGTLPLEALVGKPEAIPLPSLREVVAGGATVRIYRTSAALVVIRGATGLEPAVAPEGPPWDPQLGRLLASYKSIAAAQPGKRTFLAEIRPNRAAPVYRLVTRMERATARTWSAIVNCEVTVGDGALDAVRLEVPPEWSGPFELSPAMDHQTVLLPGQTQRHLIVRPAREITGGLSFSIRGPLKPQAGEPPHAPVLLPLDAERTSSFLLLPSRVEGQNLQWQTSGLQSLLPGESNHPSLTAKGYETFSVVAPRFEATLRQSSDLGRSARIVVADLLVRPLFDGSYWAKGTYYLVPGSRGEADLQLPAGARLVQVLVNETPAQITKEAVDSWRVRLGPELLAQKVVVVYEQRSRNKANGSQAVTPPTWLDLPLEKTTLRLLPPQGRGEVTVPTTSSAAIDPRSASLAQMRGIIRLVREAGDSTSALPTSQLAAWLALWRLEFTRVSKAASMASGTRQESAADRLELDRRTLVADFEGTLARYGDVKNGSTSNDMPSADDVLARPTAVMIQSGPPLPIAVTWAASGNQDFAPALGIAALLMVAALAVILLQRSGALAQWFAYSPTFALALAATILLALTPAGFFAAVPLAAAGWFSLRRSWPTTRADFGSASSRPIPMNHHSS